MDEDRCNLLWADGRLKLEAPPNPGAVPSAIRRSIQENIFPDAAVVSRRADAYSFDVHRDDGSVMVVEKEWVPD